LVKAIEEYVRSFTDKIETPHTREADVIFEDKKGKKWAFEVETGSVPHSDKRKFENKIAQLKTKYDAHWAFVITDSRKLLEKYQKFGTTYVRTDITGVVNEIFSHQNILRHNSCSEIKPEYASEKRSKISQKKPKASTTKSQKPSSRGITASTNTSTSKKE